MTINAKFQYHNNVVQLLFIDCYISQSVTQSISCFWCVPNGTAIQDMRHLAKEAYLNVTINSYEVQSEYISITHHGGSI